MLASDPDRDTRNQARRCMLSMGPIRRTIHQDEQAEIFPIRQVPCELHLPILGMQRLLDDLLEVVAIPHARKELSSRVLGQAVQPAVRSQRL